MDRLRARMVREGYPLPDLIPEVNERVWYSLAGRRRRPQLQALLGLRDDEIDAQVRSLRAQRTALTGKR
jgi:hypothetical protein